MNEDLIQLPELKDIKEMLSSAREDISIEVQEDPELLPLSRLLNQVIDIIEEKIGNRKELNKIDIKEKIDLAAHLNFLQGLLEDFFLFDETDLEEEEFEDEDLEEEEETSEEK